MKCFEYLFAGSTAVSTRIHTLCSFETICSLCLLESLEFIQQLQQVLGGEEPGLEKGLSGIEGDTSVDRMRRMSKLLRTQLDCV